MKDCGFINATKLCVDGGKRFRDWKRLLQTESLIATLEDTLKASTSKQGENRENILTCEDPVAQMCATGCYTLLTIPVAAFTCTARLIAGTYIHPDLVPSLAGWISPVFQIKANRIINNFLIDEYKSKLDTAQQQLALKDVQVTQLQDELIKSTATLIQQTTEQDDRINSLTQDLIDTNSKHIVAVTALSSKKDELSSWASTHAFSLLNLNDSNLQLPYYAIRCKRRKMAATIKRLRRKHPKAELIFQHRRVPNAVNLYDRLRGEKLVRSHHNYCIPTTNEVTLRAAMVICAANNSLRPYYSRHTPGYLQSRLLLLRLLTILFLLHRLHLHHICHHPTTFVHNATELSRHCYTSSFINKTAIMETLPHMYIST